MKSLRNSLKKIIPANNSCKIILKSTQLGSKFNIKDKINKKHKHDLVYKATCPNENCNETYVGEVGRRFAERIIDHHGRDKRSHLLEHAKNTGHENVNLDDFKILSSGFRNNKFKRKLAEALCIKNLKPTLNKQDQSVPIKLLT